MSTPLYIVCDTSGSMSENWRNMLTRSIFCSIEQYMGMYHQNIDIKLVSWNETATEIERMPNNEYPQEMLTCCGSLNVDSLCKFFKTRDGGKIILLSDYFWPDETKKAFDEWLGSLPKDTVRILKIDFDYTGESPVGSIFTPDNMLCLLDDWFPPINTGVV